MTKYKIVADSAANVLQLKEITFESVPLCVQAGEVQYIDTPDLDVEEMINALKTYTAKTSTACPNIYQWIKTFADADVIFVVTLTSALSGSHSAALQAKKIYQEQHPNVKICVLDSLAAGPKMQLILEKIEELILAGLDYAQIVEKIKVYQQQVQLLFSLESLTNLANNGRISPKMAKFAQLLKIRILGSASQAGTLEPLGKARGEKKALTLLVEKMQEMGFKGGKVSIAHCQNQAGALKLQELILENYPTSDIELNNCRGLCSYYAEKGGLMLGFETI